MPSSRAHQAGGFSVLSGRLSSLGWGDGEGVVAGHVPVELGDGEGGESVAGGVEEAFADESGPGRTELFGAAAQDVGDVAGFLGVRAEFGHGAEVLELQVGGALGPDPEEAGIQGGFHEREDSADVGAGDR